MHIQTTNSFPHGALSVFDFRVQGINIQHKLLYGPLQHILVARKFRQVRPCAVQVLVQKRNCVQYALFFGFENGQFLALFCQVHFQFFESVLLFVNLRIRLFRGSQSRTHGKD